MEYQWGNSNSSALVVFWFVGFWVFGFFFLSDCRLICPWQTRLQNVKQNIFMVISMHTKSSCVPARALFDQAHHFTNGFSAMA